MSADGKPQFEVTQFPALPDQEGAMLQTGATRELAHNRSLLDRPVLARTHPAGQVAAIEQTLEGFLSLLCGLPGRRAGILCFDEGIKQPSRSQNGQQRTTNADRPEAARLSVRGI